MCLGRTSTNPSPLTSKAALSATDAFNFNILTGFNILISIINRLALHNSMKFCPYCGTRYGDEAVASPTDGHQLEGSLKESSKESWNESIRGLFSRGECRGKQFICICNALAGINAGCSDYTFGIERAAKIQFRGQDVCVILGDIGSPAPDADSGGGWSRWRSVYALATSQDQIAWMAANSDVFSPARPGSKFPVFWVELDIIKANPNASPNGGPAQPRGDSNAGYGPPPVS